jgi:hypothetical protein
VRMHRLERNLRTQGDEARKARIKGWCGLSATCCQAGFGVITAKDPIFATSIARTAWRRLLDAIQILVLRP